MKTLTFYQKCYFFARNVIILTRIAIENIIDALYNKYDEIIILKILIKESKKMGFYSSAVQAAKPENLNKPLTMKDKLAYAAGDFGCNMSL